MKNAKMFAIYTLISLVLFAVCCYGTFSGAWGAEKIFGAVALITGVLAVIFCDKGENAAEKMQLA